MRKAFDSALVALCLGACVSPAPQPGPVAYVCEDGSRLAVLFEPELVRVRLRSGDSIVLPQQRAASGVLYSNYRFQLRGKGNEITWTPTGSSALLCRSQ